MPAPERQPFRTLVPVFLRRFFERESAGGAVDVRQSFIWLIAVLATPGLFLPLYHTGSRWAFIATRDGVPEARLAALLDKALYLSVTVVAMGILATVVWHTLIINRRDALVLCALPVPRRSIVAAKLAALGVYVGAASAGMHGIAALFYGFFLGGLEGPVAIIRDVSAQFVTAVGLSLWIFVTVAALQSVCLVAAGPRHFARWSVGLQLCVVATVMAALILTPLAAFSARATLSATGPLDRPWLLDLPTFWFLGLQEWLTGSSLVRVPALAERALFACAVSLTVLLVTYPLACARVLRAAIQEAPPRAAALPRRIAARITTWLAPEPAVRASVQFLLATTSRVHGHRLTLAIVAGVGLVGAITATLVAFDTRSGLPPARPSMALAAAPLYLVFALSAGLRAVVALPAELPARWPFEVAPGLLLAGRYAARRVTLAFGVVLPLLIYTPAWAYFWGLDVALLHALGSAVAGGALVEVLFWGYAAVPCTRATAPGDSRLASRGIAGFLGFVFFTTYVPAAQAMLARAGILPYGFFILVTGVGWWAIRHGGDDAARVNALTDDQDGLVMLDLVMPTQAPKRTIVGAGQQLNEEHDARRA